MATLRDVVAYLCAHYPHKDELSKARLTKMVYLADWKSALERNMQMTAIKWQFNYYGPYVDDVVESIREDEAFALYSTRNMYGEPKDLIQLRGKVSYPSLNDTDKEILDFVIKKTAPKTWNDFIRLVYSTYPILTQPRFSLLDLPVLAQEYKMQNRVAAEKTKNAPTYEEAMERGFQRRVDLPNSSEYYPPSAVNMIEWFFSHYEDPAEGVPHDSGEGGYQYIFGGPYDAREVLEENFPSASQDDLKKALQFIYDYGFEWVKVEDY
jgi:hypothetical protein